MSEPEQGPEAHWGVTDAAVSSPSSSLAHLDLWTLGASPRTPCPTNQHSLPVSPPIIRRQSQVRHHVACSLILEADEGESLQVLGQPGPQSPETTRKPSETSVRGDTKAISGEVACADGLGGEPAGRPSPMLATESHSPRSGPLWGGVVGAAVAASPSSLTRWRFCFVLLFKP